jgi:hypothetical protein
MKSNKVSGLFWLISGLSNPVTRDMHCDIFQYSLHISTIVLVLT